MGALTGNSVQSTYLDLVQLGKSGAGLPAHAGKEAALYDGSGAQILGRTAVRHWLDPHPDAASFDETWEFSTTGDMTQGELETLGWTFSNCSGSVSGGVLWLSGATSGSWAKAWFSTSMAGDFDLFITGVSPFDYDSGISFAGNYSYGGGGVGDSANDVAHHVYPYSATNGFGGRSVYLNGTFANGAGTKTQINTNGIPQVSRVSRVSAAVYATAAQGFYPGFTMAADDTTHGYFGFAAAATTNDSDTFDRIFVAQEASTTYTSSGKFCGIASIRRFQ